MINHYRQKGDGFASESEINSLTAVLFDGEGRKDSGTGTFMLTSRTLTWNSSTAFTV